MRHISVSRLVVRSRHACDQHACQRRHRRTAVRGTLRQRPAYRDGQVVRCESSDGRSRECPIDSYGRVRLVRQLSGAPCIEGQTWGSAQWPHLGDARDAAANSLQSRLWQ